MFKVIVKRGGEPIEEYDQVTVSRGKTNVATVVNATSTAVRVEEVSGAPASPSPRSARSNWPNVRPPTPPAPQLGTDDYVGDVAERSGFGGLQSVDEVTMLCVPDLMSAYQQGVIDLEAVQAVQLEMIAHCELMGNRVAILDTPPGLNAQQVKEWRVDKAGYDSAFATMYSPWIKAADPSTGNISFMPPSGHIAGIWGRNDDTRGVHKAPANEVIRGAVSLEMQFTKNEHDLLNPVGINVHALLPWPRQPRLGCPHVVLRPGLALPQRPSAVQLSGGVDPGRHQLGGLRTQRRSAVGPSTTHRRRVPRQRVAKGRPVRADPRRSVLRQVRRGDQPAAKESMPGSWSARSGSPPSSLPSSWCSASRSTPAAPAWSASRRV